MKRPAIVFVLALLAVTGAFFAGYAVSERRTAQLVSEHELSALMHYVPALAYLRKGDVNNAKSLLYTATDGPLSTLSRNNADSLRPESQKMLSRVLVPLNQAWAEDKPFSGDQWESVRALPDWVEMRRRNDTFRENYAAKP